MRQRTSDRKKRCNITSVGAITFIVEMVVERVSFKEHLKNGGFRATKTVKWASGEGRV
jgi:hypothetical protein